MDVRPLCHSDLQTQQFLLNEFVLTSFLGRFCNEPFPLFRQLLHVVYVILTECVDNRKKKK